MSDFTRRRYRQRVHDGELEATRALLTETQRQLNKLIAAVCQCGHSAGEHPDIGHWDRVPCSRCNCCQYVRVTANRLISGQSATSVKGWSDGTEQR